MDSPPSSSDGPGSTSSFFLLHEKVRRWIWEQKWEQLHAVQERAIPHVLNGGTDVIVAAPTAGGKTEAAFLPIVSGLVDQLPVGLACLYVSPLKALINDQFQRLDLLCAHLDIPVHRWHGDVAATAKHRLLDRPSGILLTTPESLEAIFVRRGTKVGSLFAGLRYVVIDELHVFIGTERGQQLQSLLHRVELAVRRRVPRVALSATLGDMQLAANFLRPGHGQDVALVVDEGEESQELRLQLRGYCRPSTVIPGDRPSTTRAREGTTRDSDIQDVGRHLFDCLRGKDNLVFANSRLMVEQLADLLRRKSEMEAVPNEFLPHHGSLAKGLREDVERRLKEHSLPLTAICTSTLELGIDIGSVTSIAQVGCPPSVAALRQRLGRSGRRGEPAVLRLYVLEDAPHPRMSIPDEIRAETVQTIAMVELLLERWCEPPLVGPYHYSTLVQQLLSLIAQHGGVTAADAWRTLCGSAVFGNVDQDRFLRLLRALGSRDLIVQTHDGLLVLGLTGERLVDHYDFYTAFLTQDDFRVVCGARVLGQLPSNQLFQVAAHIIFAGQRWKIVAVDEAAKVLEVVPSAGGRVPRFAGSGGLVHDQVRERMRDILARGDMPPFLDGTAQRLLTEGRAAFARLGLAYRHVVPDGSGTLLFPWRGDRVLDALVALLLRRGLDVQRDAVTVRIERVDPDGLLRHLGAIASDAPPPASELAETVGNRRREKHDALLPDDLLSEDFAARSFDLEGAFTALRSILANERT
ncbi:MAG: DEAD/DEAH box helicase [Candidatus Krumholzibacteriia bacterium]